MKVFNENLKNARNYSTSSVSSAAADYQHLRRAVLAWAVGPCGLVLEGLKDSSRRYATYAVIEILHFLFKESLSFRP